MGNRTGKAIGNKGFVDPFSSAGAGSGQGREPGSMLCPHLHTGLHPATLEERLWARCVFLCECPRLHAVFFPNLWRIFFSPSFFYPHSHLPARWPSGLSRLLLCRRALVLRLHRMRRVAAVFSGLQRSLAVSRAAPHASSTSFGSASTAVRTASLVFPRLSPASSSIPSR